MGEQRVERRLPVVLAADVAGYRCWAPRGTRPQVASQLIRESITSFPYIAKSL